MGRASRADMKTTTLVFVCVAFAALACAEELKAETNVGYGMGGMGMGGIWQYAPYLFAGYFDPYLFNAIFTPNMMYGNTMQALTGGKNLELDATMGASA